jgi:hypothetical protein
MAKCEYCGTDVPFFNIDRECPDCQKNFQDLVHQYREELRVHLESDTTLRMQEYSTWMQEVVDRRIAEIRTNLEQTNQYTLFIKHYLPVDAQIETLTSSDTFDVEPLNVYGAAGWRLVSFVPKTVGIGLTNTANNLTSTKSWGGGIGGNVIGVYAVLELVVTTETLKYARTGLEHSLRQTNPPPNTTTAYVSLKLMTVPGKTKKDLVQLAALSQQSPTIEYISTFANNLPKTIATRMRKAHAEYVQQKLHSFGYTTVIEPEKPDDWGSTMLFHD